MRKKMVALLAGAMLMMATSAMAIPTLQISATGASSPVLVTDGSLMDIAASAGIVSWAGSLGNFLFTVSAGTTYPSFGSQAVPQMHLNGFANAGRTGGLFTVKFSEVGYGPMSAGLNGFISSMNGAGGLQSLDVYFDAGNQLFAQTTHIADISTINTSEVFNGLPASDPFSLTMIATIDTGANGAASFDNTVIPTPEPGTMMLLGVGMLGLAVAGKRRLNKNA